MTQAIVWEAPPERNPGGRTTVWIERLHPLTERPGEWARIWEEDKPSRANQIAGNLRRRRLSVPQGKWEFVSRKIDGKGYVYARYLGES